MDIRLNLASKTYLNRQLVFRWFLVVIIFLLLLVGSTLYYGLQNYRQLQTLNLRFEELNKQVASLQNTSEPYSPEKYATVRQQVIHANEIIAADQFFWTDLLSRFEELLPADVAINAIQPDYNKRALKISAYAEDVSGMNEFLDRLLDSEDFNQVYLFSQSETDSLNGLKNHVSFSLVIQEAY